LAAEIKLNSNLTKEEAYKALLPQVLSVIENEPDFTANTANITSALKYSLKNVIWAGFYFLDKERDELVLGPFQGKTACTRIKMGKGVCGTAAARRETIVVDDVEAFPGHIYCDSNSKSEIVVPIIIDGRVIGVLDLDSDRTSNFDETDKEHLEMLIKNISYLFE
jgi:GAF domain-containing protein